LNGFDRVETVQSEEGGTKMTRILIIDDEAAICSSLQFALEDEYEVTATTDPQEGLKYVREDVYHICLLDLKLGGVDGLQVLTELKAVQSDLAVIMMTAYGTIASSVEAMKKGAYSYITKPLHMEEMLTIIRQALNFQQLNRQVAYLSEQLQQTYGYEGIIGKSPLMKQVFRLIDKVKDVDTNVLITGESGTGKELVARAIHFSGKRAQERFEVVNCAAIPEDLLESELFGYKRGAFSGAVADREGKFQAADKGTIFLDEIGDMPFSLQAKLLRVIQEREVMPLGSNQVRKVDVRVLAATNQQLKEAVAEGRFREDLYFRLNVVGIHLPALRARKQDLPFLIHHFITQYNETLDKNMQGLTEEARQCLQKYDYPGNVRELANVLEAAMVICEGDYIDPSSLPEEIRLSGEQSGLRSSGDLSQEDAIRAFVGCTVKEMEKQLISATLHAQGQRRKKTASVLGISERSLRDKIKQYGIE
jgi:two-component system, NtrC family, response regulator AtoC